MGWVVRHTGQSLDHLSHALQGPQIVSVAVGFGPFGQFHFNHAKLFTGQLRQPPGSSCAAQSLSARPPPRCPPVRNDLV
jgi:hypothetical protein